jgi:G3E family GTPase
MDSNIHSLSLCDVQVAFADRIVLNKLDLVDEAELAAVKEEIQSINHTASIIETKRSVVDLSLILNQSAFR